MSQFRINSMENVRTGILRNIRWLLEEHGFKMDNNNTIPEISKGSIVVKSGYGPGEYWLTFHNQITGDDISFEYLWSQKTKNLNQEQLERLCSDYFNGIGEEIDSSEYMTEVIRCELKFVQSERPEFFNNEV